MIQYLVDKGLRLDARSKAGFSPGYLSMWGPIESLAICLELGQDPFTHDDALGNTMLLVGVHAMLPREVGLCLLKPSECPQTELNRVGLFGMSALDYLTQFDRLVAGSLGFTEHHWATYLPTPPAIRRKYLLRFLLNRANMMMGTTDGDDQRGMCERGAHQLLLLGEERRALTMLERLLATESRGMTTPFVRGTQCSACEIKDTPLFKCRVCPIVTLCATCRDTTVRMGYNDAKECQGHEFLEFPGKT